MEVKEIENPSRHELHGKHLLQVHEAKLLSEVEIKLLKQLMGRDAFTSSIKHIMVGVFDGIVVMTSNSTPVVFNELALFDRFALLPFFSPRRGDPWQTEKQHRFYQGLSLRR